MFVFYRLTTEDLLQIGSPAHEDLIMRADSYPMLITSVGPEDRCNGVVFVDGPQQLFVRSVQPGDRRGTWQKSPSSEVEDWMRQYYLGEQQDVGVDPPNLQDTGRPEAVMVIPKLNSLGLSWEPPEDTGDAQDVRYRVFLRDAVRGWVEVAVTSKRHHVLQGLDAGTKYLIRVEAFSELTDGGGAFVEVQAFTQTHREAADVPPAAPEAPDTEAQEPAPRRRRRAPAKASA